MFGPQSAGMLVGRKDLIKAALANSDPWEGAICRPMKVGKEEVMGMLAAVEYWSHADMNAIEKESNARIERMKRLVETVPGVTTSITTRKTDISFPSWPWWDEKTFGLTVDECGEQMRDGEPRIDVWTNSNPSGVSLSFLPGRPPQTNHPNQVADYLDDLQPGEELIVGNRLRQLLNQARKQAV